MKKKSASSHKTDYPHNCNYKWSLCKFIEEKIIILWRVKIWLVECRRAIFNLHGVWDGKVWIYYFNYRVIAPPFPHQFHNLIALPSTKKSTESLIHSTKHTFTIANVRPFKPNSFLELFLWWQYLFSFISLAN